MKGLFIACEEKAAFGFSLAAVYDAEQNNFQIAAMIGCFVLAVGYQF